MRKIRKNQPSVLNLPSVKLEGALFLPDQLEKAAQGLAQHQDEGAYQIPKGLKLKDEYSRAFQIACAQWRHFASLLDRSDLDASATTLKFVSELLKDVFGYASLEKITGIDVNERHYPISLLAGHIPIVVAPHTFTLDEPAPQFAPSHAHWTGGSHKKSAFQLAQELLNASDDHLWAIVSNGKQLRLLRDADSLTRPSFLEFDLQDVLQGKRFSEFATLWRLLHASRAGLEKTPEESVWEQWREAGKEEGTRVREGLRQGVEQALLTLGEGFIQHPANNALRQQLDNGELTKEAYFQQQLRLVYRLIFLFSVEERGLLHNSDDSKAAQQARQAYAQGYALSRYRELCLKRRNRNAFDDHWQSLRIVFLGLSEGEPRLALPALGGLFQRSQCPDLDTANLNNAYFFTAMQHLRWTSQNGNLAPVDYRNMGPEELGSVYESLLELVPDIDVHAKSFGFIGLTTEGSTVGNARKTSGSYYTPDSLVQELIKSALEPVIEQRLVDNPADPATALLNIRVIDPSCGSGHFLLAAARRLAEELAQLRTPDGAVKPADYRHALREVVSQCIFGVDRNPMALELARTALWMEGFEEGRPLSFLDHHLQCGDALLGLIDLKALERGIPKAAFKALSGDDKEVCKTLNKTNTAELKDLAKKRPREEFQQLTLTMESENDLVELEAIEAMPQDSTEQIAEKENAYFDFLRQAQESHLQYAANLFLGAFLLEKTEANKNSIPTSSTLYLELSCEHHNAEHLLKRQAATEACDEANAFHWPLAFPQVFSQGGFDCVLGNPPWKRLQFEEQSFFYGKNDAIYSEENKSKRQKLVSELRETNEALWREWYRAGRSIESSYNYMKGSGSLPLAAIDKFNLYSVFVEKCLQIKSEAGMAGVVVDAGILSDKLCSNLIKECFENNRVKKIREYENTNKIFRDVHRQQRFALLTLANWDGAVDCSFGLRNVSEKEALETRVEMRFNHLSLYSPDVFSIPKFSSQFEYEIFRKCYMVSSGLVSESSNDNPWRLKISRYINVSDFSAEIKFFDELSDDIDEEYIPIFEGKLFSSYDHKYASYSGMSLNELGKGEKRTKQGFYRFISKSTALRRNPRLAVRDYFLVLRDTTHSTNERGAIASIIPNYITDYTVRVVEGDHGPRELLFLLASFNSLIIDFVARMRIGGNHLSNYIIYQLPVIKPHNLSDFDMDYITSRAFSLSYFSDELDKLSIGVGQPEVPFEFNPDIRHIIVSELDAYFAKLYGLTRDELRYILDPADVMGEDYPSETFRVLKNKEMKEYGEYRTQRLVLEAWDKLEADSVSVPADSASFPRRTEIYAAYQSDSVPCCIEEDWLAGLICDLVQQAGPLSESMLRAILSQRVDAGDLSNVLAEWCSEERLSRLPMVIKWLQQVFSIPQGKDLEVSDSESLQHVLGDARTSLLATKLIEEYQHQQKALRDAKEVLEKITPMDDDSLKQA